MGVMIARRAVYRVRQFVAAVAAHRGRLSSHEQAEIERWLPQAAWSLFERMPRNDQRHSLNVLRALRDAGWSQPPLMQAALLHDVAKSVAGVMLWHRVAVVLINAARPGWSVRMAERPAPARSGLRYPFWASVNHPRLGAEMAAAAGCDPLAVTLIRRHQEPGGGAGERRSGGAKEQSIAAMTLESAGDVPEAIRVDHLLMALRAADDDN